MKIIVLLKPIPDLSNIKISKGRGLVFELNPRIMDFIKQVLDIMYEAESKVTALVVARDFEQQLLPLNR